MLHVSNTIRRICLPEAHYKLIGESLENPPVSAMMHAFQSIRKLTQSLARSAFNTIKLQQPVFSVTFCCLPTIDIQK